VIVKREKEKAGESGIGGGEKNTEGDKSANILLDGIRRFSNSILDPRARQYHIPQISRAEVR
jgi:hypothetical protein